MVAATVFSPPRFFFLPLLPPCASELGLPTRWVSAAMLVATTSIPPFSGQLNLEVPSDLGRLGISVAAGSAGGPRPGANAETPGWFEPWPGVDVRVSQASQLSPFRCSACLTSMPRDRNWAVFGGCSRLQQPATEI